MKIEISPANIADSAGIAHVQITSYRTAYAPFFPQAYLEHFTLAEQTQDWHKLLSAAVRHTSPDLVLVAVQEGGEIVGYALGKPEVEELEAWECELAALHVLPEYQHHGIGRRLFAATARELQQRGKTVLILWTLEGNPVRAWYERLGGKLIGEKDYDIDGTTVNEVAYGWTDMDALVEQLTHEKEMMNDGNEN